MIAKRTVLIVGAGPSGLMMAALLAEHGVDFVIVDKIAGPTSQSRALGIHARSLEIFWQLDLSRELIHEGNPAIAANFIFNGKVLRRIPLQNLGKGLTEFPFLLLLEQSRTEKILIEKLAATDHEILWETEIISIHQGETGITAKLMDKHGNEFAMTADYVIGADGSHSIVRHNIGGHLEGKTYKQSLFVLDCKIDWQYGDEEMYIARSDESFAAFFPMKDGLWRIIGVVPPGSIGKDAITFDEVADHFAKRMHLRLTLHDPKWISLYHSHQRKVKNFRRGSAFLVGDAAHIHSPVGAQGMNTGLQDAYNLAWKMALVTQKKAPISLLDTYHEERSPFARKLVASTDKAFSIMLNNHPFVRFGIMHGLPVLVQLGLAHKFSREFMFKTVSQIGISYRKLSLAADASFGQFHRSAPQPGDRLPYVMYTSGDTQISLQDKVTQTGFLVLLFRKANKLFPVKGKSILAMPILEQHLIEFSEETEHLFKFFSIENEGMYIIRPDMHIAYRSQGLSVAHLRYHLGKFLLDVPSVYD